jgi:hypothetical protein
MFKVEMIEQNLDAQGWLITTYQEHVNNLNMDPDYTDLLDLLSFSVDFIISTN